ncbi:hypothetical protein BBJ28_00023737, partial [Nothophytophthora sp. Chile5]
MAPPPKRMKTDREGRGMSAAAEKAAEVGSTSGFSRRNPSHIKNKMKRQQIMQKFRKEKKDAK